MRFVLAVLTIAFALPGPAAVMAAETCTGDNCSPPATQSSPPPAQGGHDCEREKKEAETS
ncbi:MAG: hypothetical protein KF723_18230 [Rhizobiaceae bacterium]|nr:hypothetical protein [Rhizobiaceae bacterium]